MGGCIIDRDGLEGVIFRNGLNWDAVFVVWVGKLLFNELKQMIYEIILFVFRIAARCRSVLVDFYLSCDEVRFLW